MMAAARHEYAAISGPLATAVDKTLGVAFVCLPGDFQAVPIPAGVKAACKRFAMLGKSWIEITEDKNSLADVLNGSPVIDQQGESIGLFIDQKVVSLPELAQSLLSVDCKRLGFWGEETIDQKTDEKTDEKTEPEEDPFAGPAQVESTGALPGLLTTELKKSIERVATLKGKEKEAGLKAVQREFDKRIQLRKEYAAANLKSAQSKLERLNQLSAQLSKQDVEKVIQLLQEKPSAATASPDASKDDPCK